MRLHRAGTPARDISIAFYLSSFLLLVSLLFSFLLPILTMCFQINTITTTRKPRITHCKQHNSNNLRTFAYVCLYITFFIYWSLELSVCCQQSWFNYFHYESFKAKHTPPHVTYRRNLCSLSPSRLSAMVSSSLPPLKQLSYLDANSATDTFCSTLMSCFDTFCPLSSRPARTTPSAPWLSVVLPKHRSKLQKGYGTNHKILVLWLLC